MKKELFLVSSVLAMLSLVGIYVCIGIQKTLPLIAKMLFNSFGGSYSASSYVPELGGVICVNGVILVISVVLAVWAFLTRRKEEK